MAAEYTINIPAPTTPTISYLTEDALGSPRVVTNSFGEIKSRRDFFPFGEEIFAGYGSRNTNQKYSSSTDNTRKKFATYQRDTETGLDFAQSRYYFSKHGRFISPNEFKGGPDELFDFEEHAATNPTFYAELSNPQTLNLYAYALNNPLKWVDPTGHFVDNPDDCGLGGCTTDDRNKLKKDNGDDYWLDKEIVNVNASGNDGNFSTVETKTATLPELAGSWQDYAPVWGPLRGMTFNMNCRTGGCNFGRAAGNFVLLAADLSTLGAAAWGRSVARAGVTEAGEVFAREVISETTEIGATTVLRQPQSLMDQMVLDAAKNGTGVEVMKNLGDDAFKGMTKMAYSEVSAQGIRSEVHFVKNPATGGLFDFKFKPSTIQKTNSVTQYANATKNGTIVAPK